MDDFPFSYHKIDSTTWAYLSSLLLIALFFKFNRFWSFRNLDLLLIVLLAPGLLMIESGRIQADQHRLAVERAKSNVVALEDDVSADRPIQDGVADGLSDNDPLASAQKKLTDAPDKPRVISSESISDLEKSPGVAWQRAGFIWLFSVGLLLLIRLLIDPSLTRRPVLEPNLSQGGLFFFAASLMLFLTANILLSEPTQADLKAARNSIRLMQREAADSGDMQQLNQLGPGYAFFYMLPILPMFENGGEIFESDADELQNVRRYIIAAKSLAIVTQILIVLGLILFCYWNFDSLNVGVGTAAIYLMLPYTAMYTGHVFHTLPAALILWAVVFFRKPWVSGILIGLATGVAYYPFFLLPLWGSYYWERGWRRFLAGVLIAIAIGICGLIFTSNGASGFLIQLQTMFGFWRPRMDGLIGIWALGWSSWWRLPILIAFIVLCFSFLSWPAEKNLGTLVGYTGAILVAVQFWHGFDGGLYIAWYLPLLLLIIFRPNLTGRVAREEVAESRKRLQLESI